MAKKYELLKRRLPVAGGGFIEAFQMALVEFGCLGERRLNLAGYPHASESEALMSDWVSLGSDFQVAAEKLSGSADDEGSGESDIGSANRAKRAAAE